MRVHPSSAGARHGFTLVELMVVITIIGIMTAAMIPEMKGSFQDALLRSTSRELIDVFDLAGSRAVSLNQIRRVRLEEDSGRYVVERHVPEGTEDEFVPVDDVPESRGQLDARIAVEFHRPDEPVADGNAPATSPDEVSRPGTAAIVFYPDGTAEGGSILLRDRQGYRLWLRINPVTAHVHLVEMEREGAP
jgi:type II secretion system protein H